MIEERQGWDAADAEAEGWTPQQAAEFIARAVPVDRPGAPAKTPSKGKTEDGDERRESIATALLATLAGIDVWGADGQFYIAIPANGFVENWSLASNYFRDWLCYHAYRTLGRSPAPPAIETVVRTLSAKAKFEGRQERPWLRVGRRGDRIYIDLCNGKGDVVEATRDDWRVIKNTGLPFVQTDDMRPLPVPEKGGLIEELRRFVNVHDDRQFMLIVGWLVAALYPGEIFPALCINGEAGSGKTVLCNWMRSITDPSKGDLRNTPRDARDLMAAGHNNHVLAFDNLSAISHDLSDLFCRVATGSSFAVRASYTDLSEVVVQFARPILFNGISELLNRPDLAQRTLIVRLDPFEKGARRSLRKQGAEWNAKKPFILGALCDALCSVQRNLDSIDLGDAAPRMMDFAELVEAASPGLGWKSGAFLDVFNANQREIEEDVFDAQPVAVALLKFVRQDFPSGWYGSTTDLHSALNLTVPESLRRSSSWPQTTAAFGNALSRCLEMLRKRHIAIERKRSNGSKWRLAYVSTDDQPPQSAAKPQE
jgi:hypothetical protein